MDGLLGRCRQVGTPVYSVQCGQYLKDLKDQEASYNGKYDKSINRASNTSCRNKNASSYYHRIEQLLRCFKSWQNLISCSLYILRKTFFFI
jgi:hypothetical protein